MKNINRYIGTESTNETRFFFILHEDKAILHVHHIQHFKGIKNKLKACKFITLKQKFEVCLLNCPFTINEVPTTKTIHYKNYFHISDAFEVITINQKQKIFEPINLTKRLNHFLKFWNVNNKYYFRAEQITLQQKNIFKY